MKIKLRNSKKKIIKPGDNKIKPGDNKMKPKDGYKGASRPANGENLRPCAIGCGSSHPHGSLLHCKEYKKLDREGRGKVITKYKLCIKCLRPPSTRKHGPYVAECTNTGNCKFCHGPHSHLLCPKPPSVQAFLTGEDDQEENIEGDEEGVILEMELASLMEEARVHLAEQEEAAAEDDDEYDEEEDETIGNLMIITEELDESESYFLSHLKVDGKCADKQDDETVTRKKLLCL